MNKRKPYVLWRFVASLSKAFSYSWFPLIEWVEGFPFPLAFAVEMQGTVRRLPS